MEALLTTSQNDDAHRHKFITKVAENNTKDEKIGQQKVNQDKMRNICHVIAMPPRNNTSPMKDCNRPSTIGHQEIIHMRTTVTQQRGS